MVSNLDVGEKIKKWKMSLRTGKILQHQITTSFKRRLEGRKKKPPGASNEMKMFKRTQEPTNWCGRAEISRGGGGVYAELAAKGGNSTMVRAGKDHGLMNEPVIKGKETGVCGFRKGQRKSEGGRTSPPQEVQRNSTEA